jgi:hypothetical protein
MKKIKNMRKIDSLPLGQHPAIKLLIHILVFDVLKYCDAFRQFALNFAFSRFGLFQQIIAVLGNLQADK